MDLIVDRASDNTIGHVLEKLKPTGGRNARARVRAQAHSVRDVRGLEGWRYVKAADAMPRPIMLAFSRALPIGTLPTPKPSFWLLQL
jgi:hypothetical protein